MAIHLGKVKPGSTLYIPFESFNSSGASVTLTGLAVTDIEIYKNGSTTQRASDTGYTLLDTDGIDFDGVTGVHGFSLDLSSNATADFFTAGAFYWVVVSAVTIDSQTVTFIAATFSIGYEGAILDTTIATLSSQTSFTLTAGPAEDDALNGCTAIVHDIASAVQWGKAIVADYTGSTKTVTLVAGATFTAAAGDNISILPPALQPSAWGGVEVVQTGDSFARIGATGSGLTTLATQASVNTVDDFLDTEIADIQARLPAALVGGRIDANVGAISSDATAADNAEAFFDGTGYAGTNNVIPTVTTVNGLAANTITATAIANDAITAAKIATGAIDADAIADNAIDAGAIAADAITAAKIADGAIDANTFAAGAITASAIATDAIGASELAADAAAEIADAIWDEAASGHTTAGTYGQALNIVRANTAQAGASTTITLDASASATDDFYNNCIIFLTGGTGAGQARIISDYVGSSKVATVPAWVTNPSSDSVFVILPFGAIPGASAPTAAEVADAVWDEATSGHTTTGTFGEQLKTDVDAILEDTGTTLQAEVDGIQADTEDIQARLPAALVGGRIDANLGAISSDVTAADNAEAFFDGTGYAGTGNVIPTVTTLTNDPSGVTTLLSRLGTPSNLGGGATVAANLADIESQTDDIGAAGAGLTAVPWNAVWDAEVQSEVDDALVAQRLDELVNADSDIDGAQPPTVGSVFHELMTKTAGSFTYDQATDALEALRDRGDAAWATATGFSTLDAAGVRSAVGLASANLDTQLDAIPTNADLAASQAAADDATLAAIAALNNLSAAQVNAEVVDALTVDVVADSVATDGNRPTIAQAVLMILRFLTEKSVSGTTVTVKKEDGSTSSMTFTLDSGSAPTSITRAS